MRPTSIHWILFGLLLSGIFLRTYLFPNLPGGLNQDEISSAYEAYSLWTTGADRWGNPWPVYFPSWGTGQNVLYSYLSLPAIAIFGMTSFSTRIVSLICALTTLWLFYVFIKRGVGERAALWGLALLVISPWHVMISRWALESNLLPFFILLGFVTVQRALHTDARLLTWIAFLPWALAYYAYAISVVSIPILVFLVLFLNWDTIRPRLSSWMTSVTVHISVASPFIWFNIKNQILKRDLDFENRLPLTIPLLPGNRLEEAIQTFQWRWSENTKFILRGFKDEWIWNSLPSVTPIYVFTLPLALVGTIWIFRTALIKDLKSSQWARLVFVWGVALIPLPILFHLNVNRFNSFYLFYILVSASGILWAQQTFIRYSKWTTTAFVLLLLGHGLYFTHEYFNRYKEWSDEAFYAGFDEALKIAENKAEKTNDPIYVSELLPLNYMHPLFYRSIHPSALQSNSSVEVQYGIYWVGEIKPYVFLSSFIKSQTYVFLVSWTDQLNCKTYSEVETHGQWRIGRCHLQ